MQIMTTSALGRSAVLLGLLSACLGSGPGAAAMNGAFAVGAAAVSRHQGGCYAACVHGTACDHETGYCEPLPCGGTCAPHETCRETPTGQVCARPEPEVEFLPLGPFGAADAGAELVTSDAGARD